MGTFVTQATAPQLFDHAGDKADARPIPAGASAANYLVDGEVNAMRDALLDLRTFARGQYTDFARAWADGLVIFAHRGGGNISAPENTIAGFDYGASIPGAVLEFDCRLSRDNVPVISHDDTLARCTGSAVSTAVGSLSADQLARVDVSPVFMSSLFSPQYVPTFEQVLFRYGGRKCMMAEVKPDSNTLAAAMADLVIQYGLTESVVIAAFYSSVCEYLRDNYPTIKTCYVSSSLPSAATITAMGAYMVAIDSAVTTSSFVTDMHAIGVKVVSWTVDKLKTIEAEIAKGVDGVISNDPSLVRSANTYSAAGTTSTVVPPGVVGTGWRATLVGTGTDSAARPLVSSGYITHEVPASVDGATVYHAFYYPGIRPSASVATTQEFTTTLKLVAPPTSGDTGRYLGLKFCWSTDSETGVSGSSAQDGYYFMHRMTGAVLLVKTVAGVATGIASDTWAAIASGAEVPLRLNITSTAITVTRTDTAATITVNDSTHARTGHIAAFGSGMIIGVGAGSLVY